MQRVHRPSWRASVVATAIAVASFVTCPSVVRADPPSRLPYPRLANVYLSRDIDSAVIASLARWDVVVLSPVWTNEQLAELRQLHPEIKIFFYVIAYAIGLPSPTLSPWNLENYQYVAANDLWWYDQQGEVASDWPGTGMCNVTALGPNAPLGSWREYFPARVEQLVDSHPELDGVFMDNYWRQISWQQKHRHLDSDCNPTHNPAGCDGVADSNARLDSLWNDALRGIAADIRARLDVLQRRRPRPLALTTNGASDYFQSLNGTMAEYFPSGNSNVDYDNLYGYNWNQEMLTCAGGYLTMPFRESPYEVRVLNADWVGTELAPLRGPDFERHKRFTLVSTLLGDGYYSLDAASLGHSNLWWEPEYDHAGRGKGYLGQPLGPMQRILSPAGPELLVNGDFTAGATGWYGYPFSVTGSSAVDGSVKHSVPLSYRIDVTSVSPGGYYKVWQTSVPLVHHQAYTLSFWARAAGPGSLLVHLYSEACPANRCWNDRELCLSSDWTRYEISFSSAGTATAGFDLFVSEPGSVWIDDVSLRAGDTSLFRRDFEDGIVLLNYTNVARTVELGGTYWRPRIPQNAVFDGRRVTQEIVPPSDARIVLRDSTTVPDTSIVSDVPPAARASNVLWQNDPNPFNPTTRIRFSLARDERATLAVYDVAGRRVRTLVGRPAAAGIVHEAIWNGRDDRGRPLPSGVYVYRLSTPTFEQSRKLLLVR